MSRSARRGTAKLSMLCEGTKRVRRISRAMVRMARTAEMGPCSPHDVEQGEAAAQTTSAQVLHASGSTAAYLGTMGTMAKGNVRGESLFGAVRRVSSGFSRSEQRDGTHSRHLHIALR